MKDFRASRETKRVPAHTPLMINRDIMEELQNRYSEQYRKTSTNRFRSSDDMQYAFVYFHWLILSSRRIDFKIEEFLKGLKRRKVLLKETQKQLVKTQIDKRFLRKSHCQIYHQRKRKESIII